MYVLTLSDPYANVGEIGLSAFAHGAELAKRPGIARCRDEDHITKIFDNGQQRVSSGGETSEKNLFIKLYKMRRIFFRTRPE